MSTITINKKAPHASSASFSAANSIDVSGNASVFIRAPKGASVDIYTSADLSNWTLTNTIDASNASVSFNQDIGAGVNYINITTTSSVSASYKVHYIKLSEGLFTVAARPKVLTGEAVSDSEKQAMNLRLQSLESQTLQSRSKYVAPSSAAAGILQQSGMTALLDKSHMVFVNGRAVHPDDYVIDPADDGGITFNFDVAAGSVISAAVWE
tara:strand:+ start:941 stop:1570 length:630 start_codon:yes stop_codon:yes gene_type:complete